MVLKNISITIGTFSLVTLAYLYYIKRCYKYLKSFGYDGPTPRFLIGNLLDFVSKENSVSSDPNRPAISHYSKTLRRWTKIYGKIYGYYEGHSPVLVLADPDLVTEVFVNQNKLVTYRRSFPMSKNSNDPNADIFINNGIRWLRVRYGLEKVMLNNKNTARCLEYADECFINTFLNQPNINKPLDTFNIFHQVKLLMIQTMFSVIFGSELNNFINEKPIVNTLFKKHQFNDKFKKRSNLFYTNVIAHKFSEAFTDFESFSLLKFFAMLIPELAFIWRRIDTFKRLFNQNIFHLSYFADPMDWFYSNFINKHLLLYTQENDIKKFEKNSPNSSSNDYFNFNQRFKNSKLQSQSISINTNSRNFSYFNSFLFLTYNPIIKYNQSESPHRKVSVVKELVNQSKQSRAMTRSERYSSLSSIGELNTDRQRIKSLSSMNKNLNDTVKIRHYSTDHFTKSFELNQTNRNRIKSTRILNNEIESEDFENWKLTINEALSNTLLMFFAGYETTSSAIGFCCKVISTLSEQREKLIDELNENWGELEFNLDKYKIEPIDLKKHSKKDQTDEEDDDEYKEESLLSDEDNDDVFEDDKNSKEYTPPNSKSSKTNLENWNDLYESLEKLKYLDMFVKEVLRMFPIASSMVSRKCVVDDLVIDNGNYRIPNGINIVVDVASIHYDPVIWGPVDPESFYPERFLTERNPAAWLPFGIGSRKCLGIKLAMSQIKLFIVRLLQNYVIDKVREEDKNNNLDKKKFSDIIETKDILFNSPIGSINVSLRPKNSNQIF